VIVPDGTRVLVSGLTGAADLNGAPADASPPAWAVQAMRAW
jgi:hypothetical protein